MAVNRRTRLSALCAFLRNREILLVLDNCEHIIDAAAACVDRILTKLPV